MKKSTILKFLEAMKSNIKCCLFSKRMISKLDFFEESLNEKLFSNQSRWKGISSLILLLIFFLFSNLVSAQAVSNNSQWGKNGAASAPASPVNWANGNSQGTNSHFAEGESVPTRIEVTGLTAGVEATLTFNINVIQGSNVPPKHAFDFITGPNRISEAVQPLDGLTGYGSVSYFKIPVPSGTVAVGTNGYATGGPFDLTAIKILCLQLNEAAEPSRNSIWSYNAAISKITYAWGDELGSSTQQSYCTITFTPSSTKALFALGCHIGAEELTGPLSNCVGWGTNNGATSISGSPYHFHIANICQPITNCINLGSQDQQMDTSAIITLPKCSVSPPATVCDASTTTFTATGIGGSGGAPYTFVWTGPGGFTATAASITVGVAGTYSVTVKDKDGNPTKQPCTTELIVNPKPTASAGPDQLNCQTGASGPTSFTLSGTATNGTTLWTVFAKTGTADATFGDATSLTSSVNVTGNGTITLRLTTTSSYTPSCGSATDDVVLTVNPNPTANAGPDDTKCQTKPSGPTLFTLGGTATNGASVWSLVTSTGTASANITTPSSLTSEVSVTGIGSVTLRLTTTSSYTPSCGFVTDEVVLTVNPNSTANAGMDEAKCQTKPSGPTPFTLSGTATNGTTLWTVFSKTGTADATFGDATSLTSSVNFTGTGTVTLRLTTTSTLCGDATDEVMLTVNPNPVIVCPEAVSLPVLCKATQSIAQAQANTDFATWFAQAPVSDANYLVTAIYVYSSGAAPSPEGTAPLILAFNDPTITTTSVTVTWTIKNRITGCDNSCSSIFTLKYGCLIDCKTSVTNLTCNGDQSGSIKVTAGGGTQPYIIYLYKASDLINAIADSGQLSTEPGVYTFSGLAAGDYLSESTDVVTLKGNGSPCPATITEPKAVALEIASTNVSCFEKADGKLSIVSSDGTGTSTFSLSSDGTTFNVIAKTDLEASKYGPGTYYIKVSYPDGNTGTGTCDLTKSTTIKEPALVSIKISGTNVTCNGNGDGKLSIVNYTGGDNPIFSLKKDDGAFVGMTKDAIEGGSYGPGTYTIQIDFPDGNNPPGYGICSSAQDKVIIQPSQVVLAISSTNVTCNAAANGKLSIDNYSGTGTPTFSISTDGGATFSEKSEGTIEAGSYGPGTYTIKVSYPDSNNPTGSGTCFETKSTTITEPDQLDLALTPTGATCFGSANGSISAAITGSPWSDLQISLDNSGTWAAVTGTPVVFNGLASVSHTVALRRISDNTCTTSKDVSVTQPDKLDLVLTPKNTSCEGVQDGSISAVVTGTPLSDLEINVDSGAFADVTGSPVVFSGLAAGDHTIVLHRKSDNSCSVSMKSTVVSTVCAKALCTYTQGAYGNPGGKYCDGINGNLTTSALITQAISHAGGTITIGSLGHSVIIKSSDVDCVISRLPGGGPAKELPSGDVSICSLPNSYLKNGRIGNVLLSQTITLALNINSKGTSDLANFVLQPSTLATAALEGGCGTDVAKTRVCGHCVNDVWVSTVNEYTYRSFSATVFAALGGNATVAGLLDLANRALADSDGKKGKESGASLSDIANAVASINEVFDGCRISMGWDQVKCPVETLCPDGSTTSTAARSTTSDISDSSDGLVKVYPNPFKDHLTFELTANVSGTASLQIFNLLGQKVADLFNGYLEAGTTKVVEYNSTTSVNQTALIYMYKLGNATYTGKLKVNK